MISLINSILFIAGGFWALANRVKFERANKGNKSDFSILYREHNSLQMILFFALAIFCVLNYLGME